MADFLERIETAWNTSKQYKRRVSILLLSYDRNYTLERICRRSDSEILKDAAIYHISALGRRKLKSSKGTIHNIPANVAVEPFAESEPIIRRISDDVKESGVFIVDDFLKQLDDSRDPRHPIGTNRQFFFDLFERTLDAKCGAQVYIFLEHSEKRDLIPDIVDAEIQIVEHPYPTREEVKEIAVKEIDYFKARTRKTIDNEMDFINGLLPHLAGFAFSTISWMIRDAFIKHAADASKLDSTITDRIIKEVKERKEILMGQQLGMCMMKVTAEKPVGVDNFLSYVEKRETKICISGQDRLKGVLFIGPPGTGKSMLAKYLSGYMNIPAIEVRLSSLMSQWLGETEKLFRRLTDVIDAMAPVIVYIDEIEKMFPDESSSSGGGASMVRATGHLLTWMNDTTAPIFIIATANNVARMGEIGLTMTRRGRFDALFYIGYPDKEGRRRMFEFYAKGNGLTKEQLDTIADMTPFFTGADIRGVVQDASHEASPSSYYDALINAINEQKSQVEAMREMYRANTGGVMRRLARPAGNFEPEA